MDEIISDIVGSSLNEIKDSGLHFLVNLAVVLLVRLSLLTHISLMVAFVTF